MPGPAPPECAIVARVIHIFATAARFPDFAGCHNRAMTQVLEISRSSRRVDVGKHSSAANPPPSSYENHIAAPLFLVFDPLRDAVSDPAGAMVRSPSRADASTWSMASVRSLSLIDTEAWVVQSASTASGAPFTIRSMPSGPFARAVPSRREKSNACRPVRVQPSAASLEPRTSAASSEPRSPHNLAATAPSEAARGLSPPARQMPERQLEVAGAGNIRLPRRQMRDDGVPQYRGCQFRASDWPSTIWFNDILDATALRIFR